MGQDAAEEIQRVTAALLESERRFRRMADATPDVIWITDLQPEKVVYASPSFERIWGRTVLDLYDDPHLWIEGIHPEDRARIGAAFMAWIAHPDDRPWEAEFRVLRPDGEVRWIHERGAVISEAGGPQRVSGISTDITQRRATEIALKESEERFALSVAGSADGIWDWDILTDQMFMSERCQILYGLEPGITTRQRSEWLQMVKMPTVEVAQRRQAIADYVAGLTPVFDNEWRVRHLDGSDRWIRLRGLCVRDAQGKATRFSGSITDIDARKRSDAALQESEQRFVLAVAGSNDGLWDWDIDSDEMFFSERAQRLYGLEVGPTFRPRAAWRSTVKLHPDDVPTQSAMIEDYLAGRVPSYDGEWRVRHADGSYRWIRIRGVCIRDPKGRPTRMAGSVSDIDAHKRAQAALQQAQRLEAVGTLAGGIAHDFNNILGAILGFGQMALKNTRAGSRLRRDVECILTAGERGRSLVDRILTFSQSGISARTPVHVEGVVVEALELLTATLPRGIGVEADLHAGHAAVLCDVTKIHQLLTNLTANAVHAMGRKGTLRVKLELVHLTSVKMASTGPVGPGDYLSLSVADDGKGIAPDIVPQIFDPFFTTKEVGEGTGLGLSLVHGIVNELDGAIDVLTEPGVGSTFTVFLPRSGDALVGEGVEPIQPTRGLHQLILVVDDEEALVRLTTDSLGALGYVCVGYTSSKEAFAAFQAHPDRFDAIVTDERMPGLTGTSLAAAVHQIRPTVPVLLVSGYLNDKLLERAKAASVTEILGKPVNVDEIAVALGRAMPAPSQEQNRVLPEVADNEAARSSRVSRRATHRSQRS